jgi:hypothetical protein
MRSNRLRIRRLRNSPYTSSFPSGLDLVLGLARAEALRQVPPVAVQPAVGHFQQAPRYTRVGSDPRIGPFPACSYTGLPGGPACPGPRARRRNPAHCGVEAEPLAQDLGIRRALGRLGEDAELHRAQQFLRAPGGEAQGRAPSVQALPGQHRPDRPIRRLPGRGLRPELAEGSAAGRSRAAASW